MKAVASLTTILVLGAASCAGSVKYPVPRDQADTLAPWSGQTRNMTALGATQVQWPPQSEIASFFPLGFSTDGWFAYSDSSENAPLAEPLGDCTGTEPCYDVSLLNVFCDSPCSGDIDPTAGAKCRCLRGLTIPDLQALGVTPATGLQDGEFPARFDGVEYDIELTYREKAIYPEVLSIDHRPEFPETQVHLIVGGKERFLIARIDHNHAAILPGLRVAGWLKHPTLDRIVVLLLCHTALPRIGDEPAYLLNPFAVELKRPTASLEPP